MCLWRLHAAYRLYLCMCVSLQGYEVRKITAIDQDLGRPRGIGYTIITGLSHIIDLTSAAQRGESITSYHNSTVIIDKSHQAQQSITAERSSSELENRPGSEHLLITVLVQLCRSQLSFCVIILKLACAIKTGLWFVSVTNFTFGRREGCHDFSVVVSLHFFLLLFSLRFCFRFEIKCQNKWPPY